MRNSIQAIRRLRWADMTRREVLVATVFATASRAAGFASGALDLDFASALDAAAAIRNKRVSSVELTERMLARIERYNPKLDAFVYVTRERALREAHKADEAGSRGEPPCVSLPAPA